jgi:hypothetical protein
MPPRKSSEHRLLEFLIAQNRIRLRLRCIMKYYWVFDGAVCYESASSLCHALQMAS